VLILDEPTNHLDLDSKEVLLDALADYGGTLIFVSHDRYFVERLATKIVEIAGGDAFVYPGTYREFLWHKEHPQGELQDGRIAGLQEGRKGSPEGRKGSKDGRTANVGRTLQVRPDDKRPSHEDKKRTDAAARKRQRALQARQAEIDALEQQISECEASLREIEQTMASPGFYENRDAAQPTIERHQELMWRLGDLMHQWETLQSATDLAEA
jgi:ATP-binding cassette subfamily F protein 3